jgi:prepilin-type N-terminal cleavage/methylation domain-containing protein
MSRVFSRHFVSNRRQAFTLVELLVVIAIIGTLVALLMPAVQSARESARRMSCGNNLHNLALAVQNYHDSLLSFPTGYFAEPNKSIPGEAIPNAEGWAWGALILPFMEQKNLHDGLGVTRGSLRDQLNPSNSSAQNVANLAKTPVPLFICPSDSGAFGRGQVPNQRAFDGGLGFASLSMTTVDACRVGVSNYMGVAGHRDVIGNAGQDLDPNSGVFFANSYVRMSDIVDGTSNTFMIGERESLTCFSGAWVGMRNPHGGSNKGPAAVIGQSRPKLNQPDPPINYNATNGCGEGFSSLHPNGAQFASVDGAVRFVSNGINWNWVGNGVNGHKNTNAAGNIGVYQRLMSRNDKLPVGDF